MWYLACIHSLSRYNIQLRAYRIAPPDSPIWQVVQEGDLLRVQQLLDRREAFATDKNQILCDATPLSTNYHLTKSALNFPDVFF